MGSFAIPEVYVTNAFAAHAVFTLTGSDRVFPGMM